MKGISYILILLLLFSSLGCQNHKRQVLIILRTTEVQETNETMVLLNGLGEAGYQGVLATPHGDSVYSPDQSVLWETMELQEITIQDYLAVVIPSDNRKNLYYGDDSSREETTRILSEAHEQGIIIVAQRWGVVTLAEAGILDGREYAFPENPLGDSRFIQANLVANAENNIVQDQNIITSSSCPYVNPGVDILKVLLDELEEMD